MERVAVGQAHVEAMLFADWLGNEKLGLVKWVTPTWVKEVVFESVRREHYANVPGRCHNVVYLWADLETARANFHRTSAGQGTVYVCTYEVGAVHGRYDVEHWERVSLDVARPMPEQFDELRAAAHDYSPERRPLRRRGR